MDSTGWHAQRRAAHANDPRYSAAQRGPDGRYQPVEQVYPLDEGFVGGFKPPPPSSVPPPAPEKDNMGLPSSRRPSRGKRTPSNYTVPPPEVRDDGVSRQTSLSSYSTSQLTQMSAVERSHNLRVARMNPQLQFMCGPLLRYDTVDEEGVWNGAALIVTADAGSTYDPYPMLTYHWDPERPATLKKSHQSGTKSFDLGPHPADPMAAMYSPNGGVFTNGSAIEGPNAQKRQVPGQEIWVYVGNGGTFTFWRFLIQIPLSHNEMRIRYTVNNGLELEFVVPARNQNMRLATYSCNGFSAGVNADEFRSPGFASGYDPVWVDLLSKHAEQPFHALVGGGDQLYCDGLTREPELQEWVNDPNAEHKRNFPLTQEMFGAFARANSSIPMMNMADDHDLIDGFGSYPDDLQTAPVFKTIGSRGYFFFLLFQCFINDELDGTNDEGGAHINRSIIIGTPGPYISSPSHSFLSYLGPTSWMLLLDCRAERKLDQVCSQGEYRKVFARLHNLPPHVEHLVVQIGIPIAYPRMVFLETMLGSKFNPLTAIGRAGSLGLKGFVNKFNADAELLDDLNDHWTSRHHKGERNWFIEQLQLFAQSRRIRVSFLSGDVHCAAVGILKTLPAKKAGDIPPSIDYRYMINVVTSAIVNTPPPGGVLKLVSSLSTKTHRTMHYAETDETMMPIFVKEPDGSPAKSKFIMGRRNWCSVVLEPSSGDLLFDIRVEKMKGYGETFGYIARAPAPRWNPKPAGP